MSREITIRRAKIADVAAITEIYNEAIATTTATFDTEPKTVAERSAWFEAHDERHPILVAVCEESVVGWSSLSKWSERRAYDDTSSGEAFVFGARLFLTGAVRGDDNSAFGVNYNFAVNPPLA